MRRGELVAGSSGAGLAEIASLPENSNWDATDVFDRLLQAALRVFQGDFIRRFFAWAQCEAADHAPRQDLPS
jgi:hypothetical protein